MSHLKDIPNITLLTLDVTSPSSIKEATDTVAAKTGGKLDYLVNNAGSIIVMPTLDIDIDAAKAMYDINIWGMLRITQSFANMVVEARGTAVAISSAGPLAPAPWVGLYTGSKAAITAISETFRLELAPFGVRVVTVITGGVETNIFRGKDGANYFKLPPSSKYLSVEKDIAATARGEHPVFGSMMQAEVFAERVVGDVLGGADGMFWRGKWASTLGWITPMLMKWTGLDVMMKQKAD
ncbi:hypothetical protein OEA41_006414 [Lepraria neglecta]|uniref:NAD(P)-binding protein n=1 Tax=Lepraria neglecta TaxID=209136 RepID=A0AAD9Z7Y0_9LECA|nr:hypothetical protein OEA41_006414 [Lepraria neglecta]